MHKEVQIQINSREGMVFNLGEILEFLSKPPYGLYPNMINMAILGFLMREYIGKLYEAGTGKPIEKEIMRDKVLNLYEYWTKKRNSEKLEVRLGTEEEKKLIHDLCEIFDFEFKRSLNDIKWTVREWIKSKAKFPIWVFKLKDNISDDAKNAIETISYLIESVDRDFNQEDIKDAFEMINSVKTDLSLLFQKEDQCEDLFKKWLDRIDNIIIDKNKYTEIIVYIKQNMPEEIGVASWTEDKVREKVKDWYIQKDKHPINLKAKFTYNKQSEHTFLKVQFFDESIGTPLSWKWNFDVYGKGETNNEKYPVYIYRKSGKYTVSLKVTDTNGNTDEIVKQDCIEVAERPVEYYLKKEEILKKIKNYQGDFKNLLIKMVNEHEEFLNILDKYLND